MARPKGRKKEAIPISIDKELVKFLRHFPNASAFVNEAIKEKKIKDMDPVARLKEIILKQEQLALEMKKLGIQRTELEDKIAVQKIKLREAEIKLFRAESITTK